MERSWWGVGRGRAGARRRHLRYESIVRGTNERKGRQKEMGEGEGWTIGVPLLGCARIDSISVPLSPQASSLATDEVALDLLGGEEEGAEETTASGEADTSQGRQAPSCADGRAKVGRAPRACSSLTFRCSSDSGARLGSRRGWQVGGKESATIRAKTRRALRQTLRFR